MLELWALRGAMGRTGAPRPAETTESKNIAMSHQESANIRMIGVKVKQELFRKLEKRVKERCMTDISQLVRFLITEECMSVELTKEDEKIIQDRKTAKKGAVK